MFGAVEWINGNPILDGMPIFDTKQDCLDYISHMKHQIKKMSQLKDFVKKADVQWTLIRLRKITKAIQADPKPPQPCKVCGSTKCKVKM